MTTGKQMVGLLFLVICSLACNKKKEDKAASYLRSDKKVIAFTSFYGKDSVIISSTSNWKISSLPSWLSANNTSGNPGETKIVFSCLNNEQIDSRKTDLEINSVTDSMAPVTLTIDQAGVSPSLSTDRTELKENGAGQKDSITISSNLPWTIILPSNTTWINLNKLSGTEGTTKVYFQLPANTSDQINNADIYITPVRSGPPSVKLHVSQDINYAIKNFNPFQAAWGDTIVINGLFPPHPVLRINNQSMPLLSSNSAKIVFIIPANASSGKIDLSFDNNITLSSSNDLTINSKVGWSDLSVKPLPGNDPHTFGISFVYDNKIYYGLGIDASQTTYSRNFHVYDPVRNEWTLGPTIPKAMNPRRYASCFILDKLVYIGFGAYSNQSDWWSFDPSKYDNDAWKKLTSYAVPGFGAIAFANNNKAFAGVPQKDGNLSWLNLSANAGLGNWEISISGSFPKLIYSSTFSINGETYIAGGLSMGVNSNTLYQFSAGSNSLKQLASAPVAFMDAPSFSLNGKGYVIVNSSLYQYDPDLNLWRYISTCPSISGAYNAQVINRTAYAFTPNGTIFRLIL